VRGFEKAEKAFMDKIYNPATRELKDKSGSCAIVVLIVQEICYVANVGDSRAVLSCEGGQKVYPLSLDHKPGEDCETERIRAAGGQIYYRTTKGEVMQYDENKIDK
jgi:serine/threonine protein phosphatase PrpC